MPGGRDETDLVYMTSTVGSSSTTRIHNLLLAVAAMAAMVLAVPATTHAATGRIAKQRGAVAHIAVPKRPKAHASIVNGYTPDASQWPWIAAISAKYGTGSEIQKQFCGGTLITPGMVL